MEKAQQLRCLKNTKQSLQVPALWRYCTPEGKVAQDCGSFWSPCPGCSLMVSPFSCGPAPASCRPGPRLTGCLLRNRLPLC